MKNKRLIASGCLPDQNILLFQFHNRLGNEKFLLRIEYSTHKIDYALMNDKIEALEAFYKVKDHALAQLAREAV